jgi:hypothetical protein
MLITLNLTFDNFLSLTDVTSIAMQVEVETYDQEEEGLDKN